nr:cupin domain-containing protein [Oceanococcus sp. HetDA_MAG_MS8]
MDVEGLVHERNLTEFFTEERCSIVELSNDPRDPAVSIAQARVAPGVCTQWHRLEGIVERYVIVSGRGEAEVGDQDVARVGPQDVVWIPAGARQRIRNIGSDDLIFLAICTPRFIPSAYTRLEDAL